MCDRFPRKFDVQTSYKPSNYVLGLIFVANIEFLRASYDTIVPSTEELSGCIGLIQYLSGALTLSYLVTCEVVNFRGGEKGGVNLRICLRRSNSITSLGRLLFSGGWGG